MRILIAEADSELLREMQEALEQAGHDVSISRDGMSAWDRLTSARPPDLLVTCLHLGPNMLPGTALGRCARSRLPPIPVIYTPSSIEQAEYADPEHGAVLVKPFVLTELLETVDRWLPKQGLTDVCERPLPATQGVVSDGIE